MSNNIIAESTSLPSDIQLGNFNCIGNNVTIGKGSIIGSHVVIHDGTTIGENVRIDDGAIIGKQPMKAANSAVTKEQGLPPTTIGNEVIIGTYAVIYTGSIIGNKVLVADLSTIRENVQIGEATIVGRGVAIENYCKVGSYCKLETNVYLTAYSELSDYVFIAPCVATSNDNFVGRTKERFEHFKGVVVERGGRIGVNSTILPGKTIGEDALIAAGAVLTKDAPPYKIMIGSPAKILKSVPKAQLLENQ